MKKSYTLFLFFAICVLHLSAQEITKYDTGDNINITASGVQLKSASAVESTFSLTTTWAANNGSPDGNMFDVTTYAHALLIEALDIHVNFTGESFTLDVYTKSGTYQGNITNPGAWTKVATGTGIGAGSGNPTHVDISDFTLPANALTGLYIDIDKEDGIKGVIYTNGSGSYSNSDLKLDLGVGVWGNFGTIGVFEPRIWNGTIFYSYPCPENISVFTDPELCGAVVSYLTPPGTQTAGFPSGSLFPVGTTTNTFTNPDCSFTVTVTDNEKPTLVPTILPPVTSFTSGGWTSDFTGINVNNTGKTYAIVEPGAPVNLKVNWNMWYSGSYCPDCITQHYITLKASALNICKSWHSPATNLNQTFNAPTTPGVYYISIASSWYFSCNQFGIVYGANTADYALGYIIVGSKTACPLDVVKNADPGLCTATISKGIDVVPFDNCEVQSLTYNMTGATTASGNGSLSTYTFNTGVTNVEYTVTDVNSNSYSCNFTVTVNDTQKPVVSCPAGTTVYADPGTCQYMVKGTEFDPTYSDNCAVTDVWNSITGGALSLKNALFNVGDHTIVWEVKDAAGNTSSCSFTVKVVDNQAPTLVPTILPPVTSFTSGGWTSDFTGINVNNTGKTYAIVEPGAPVNLKVNWNMWYSGSYCEGCITQHYITLKASGLNICKSWFTPVTNLNQTFNAPTTPGVYYISLASSWYYSCNQFGIVYGANTADYALGYIIVGSNTACPLNVVKNTDPGQCTALISKGIDVVPLDNCGVASLTYSLTGATGGSGTGSLSTYNFEEGVTTVNYLVTDVNGNAYSCSFTVTVNDNELPVVTCPTPSAFYENDPDKCSKSLTLMAKATDNCGIESVRYFVGVNEITFPYEFPVGTTTVVVVATDIHGLTKDCSYNVVVKDTQRPAITCPVPEPSYPADQGVCTATLGFSASVSDNCGVDNVRYFAGATEITMPYPFPVGSTPVKVMVTDVNGLTNACVFTVKVVDTQPPVITCPVTAESYPADPGKCSATLTLEATATDNCAVDFIKYYIGAVEITFPYAFPIGTTTVKAVATDIHGNSSSCIYTVKVIDKVCVDYSGVTVASTPTGTAKIVLAATITDKDNGCVTGLKVNFIYNGQPVNSGPVSVGLVNPGDPTVGTASFEWSFILPAAGYATYDMDIELVGDGYVIDNDCDNSDFDVTVSKPLPEFITGGGYLVLKNSAGIKAGDPGSRNNFGFNVKWNKTVKNLQGNFNTIVRRREADGFIHTWQVKCNAMTSLTVLVTPLPKTAVFTGKASIQDISEYPIVLLQGDGNATLQAMMSDVGEPGKDLDLLGVTVWNKAGGVWFSSNWDGVRTAKQAIAHGNLQVNANSSVKTATLPSPENQNAELLVYPNPFSESLHFEFVSRSDVKARIDLYDVTGRMIRTVFDQAVEAGQVNQAEFIPAAQVSGMYLYRLTMGDEVYNGKVMYKK